MRTSAKLGLTALIAAMLLASALSTASARRLEVSNQGFLVSWSRLEFQASFGSVRCQVTLDGSFHSRTIPKVERLLIGHITQVIIKKESCTGGEALIEGRGQTLPWHVTYESFTGTLPSITSVSLLLRGALFRINVTAIGLICLYGLATDNITGRANLNAAGEVTTLQPVAGRNAASLLEGINPGELFGCPRSGNLVAAAEDGIVRVLNAWTTTIRIRLI